MHAFRCKNCGHIHHAEHAGDNHLPHACCVCGKGVQHGPDYKDVARRLQKPGLSEAERLAIAEELNQANLEKTYDPDNWEVLADCTPGRLKELGITAAQVVRHTPKNPPKDVRAGRSVAVLASDTFGVEDQSS